MRPQLKRYLLPRLEQMMCYSHQSHVMGCGCNDDVAGLTDRFSVDHLWKKATEHQQTEHYDDDRIIYSTFTTKCL